MHPLFLIAAAGHNHLWWAIPLIVVISLVYAGTRHEEMTSILIHAGRIGVWILSFMAMVFVVLALMSWWVSR